MQKGVRFTVDMSPQLNEILERLAEDYRVPKSEVFRRAIGLLDVSHEAVKRGRVVGAVEKENEDSLKTEFVGF